MDALDTRASAGGGVSGRAGGRAAERCRAAGAGGSLPFLLNIENATEAIKRDDVDCNRARPYPRTKQPVLYHRIRGVVGAKPGLIQLLTMHGAHRL